MHSLCNCPGQPLLHPQTQSRASPRGERVTCHVHPPRTHAGGGSRAWDVPCATLGVGYVGCVACGVWGVWHVVWDVGCVGCVGCCVGLGWATSGSCFWQQPCWGGAGHLLEPPAAQCTGGGLSKSTGMPLPEDPRRKSLPVSSHSVPRESEQPQACCSWLTLGWRQITLTVLSPSSSLSPPPSSSLPSP